MTLLTSNGKLVYPFVLHTPENQALFEACCCGSLDCCNILCAQPYLEAVVTLQTIDGEIVGTLRLDSTPGVGCEFSNEENGDQFIGDYQAVISFVCPPIGSPELRTLQLGHVPSTCLSGTGSATVVSANQGSCCPYSETYAADAVTASCDAIYSGTVEIKTPDDIEC